MLKISLFLGTLLMGLSSSFQPFAYASDLTVSDDQAELQRCFSGPLPAYLVALKHSSMSFFDTQAALENSCADLGNPEFQSKQSIVARIGDAIFYPPGMAVSRNIPSVLRDMLGDDTTVKEYRVRLAALQKIKNRFERIKGAYLLAVSAQGQYAHDSDGNYFLMTPSKILNRAKQGKSGGVCRDFAKLLEWSLLQVNMSPTLSPELKQWGGLDEDSFSVQTVADSSAGHAWVEVILPVGSGEKQVFHHLHLDSTWYKTYSPLFPRRTIIPESQRRQLTEQCRAVSSCVQDLELRRVLKAKLAVPAANPEPCH